MAKNRKNPYNDQSNLFKSLTRLFSGPIVQRRTQTGRQLRRRHLDIYANRFRSATGKQFKKAEYNPMNVLTANMISNRNRAERYTDFDQMEYTPEIASSLDIYADEMTTHSSLQPMLRIKCPNEEIKSILHSLFHNILNIEHNLFGWSRTMCKYGDLFLYLDIDDQIGVRSVIGMPQQEVERLEGEDETNPNYVQFQWNTAGLTLENWQVAHFRILGNDKHAPYGTSTLEPARRIWRQLTLLEDAMMAYRIVRSPERRVFYIDVGSIAPQDVEQYMQKVMTQMKRHQVVDPTTGQVDLRYNPMSVEEDYYIPVRGTSNTKIDNLAGGQFTGTVEDVKYLRDKLFSALKVPQSYLSMGEGASEDKTTLAQKDIRFARTIQRLQRVVIAELEKIGIIHLYTLGFRDDDLLSFKLFLNNPSKIAELQELEHWDKRFAVASNATDGFFSKRWVAEHIFGLSEEEFIRNQREMFFDKNLSAQLEGAAQPGGMGGGSPFSDAGTGADDPQPPSDAGGDDKPSEPEAPEDNNEEENILLAEPSPGNRPDYMSRGPYDVKKKTGKRGGRTRSINKQVAPESVIGSTARSVYSGYMGPGGLQGLGNGVTESKTNPDVLEEQKLFNISAEVTNLLNSLQKTETNDESEAQ